MSRRTTYLKTKQEISLNKNFSTSLNTMIENLENIAKYRKDKTIGKKYAMFETKDFKYITLQFNKNNGKYLLEMRQERKDLSSDTKIIYIREYAQKNKQDTFIINSKLNQIDNFKPQDIESIKKLIQTYENNGINTFFANSKDFCIGEISKVIGSLFNAKKIYTMIINKLNLIDESIKDIEKHTSKYQMSKIKNKDTNFNEKVQGQFDKTVNKIDLGYEATEDLIKYRFKEQFEKIDKLYEKQEKNAYNVLFNDAEDEDKETNGFDSPIDREIEKINQEINLEAHKLKLKFSASKLFLFFDLLDEYADIKLFNKEKQYQKTSTLIKKFYQDKIKNIKKYRGQYDKYLHNRNERAQKVKEIEYFDKMIIKNLNVMGQLLCSIENIEKPNLSTLMDNIKNVLEKQYLDDKYLLRIKSNKLEKLYNLLICLIEEYQEQTRLAFLAWEYDLIQWNNQELEKMKEEELKMCEEFYEEHHSDEPLSEEDIETYINNGSLF